MSMTVQYAGAPVRVAYSLSHGHVEVESATHGALELSDTDMSPSMRGTLARLVLAQLQHDQEAAAAEAWWPA